MQLCRRTRIVRLLHHTTLNMLSDYQNLACLAMVEFIHVCACPSRRPCRPSRGSTGRRRSTDRAGSARRRSCPPSPPSVAVGHGTDRPILLTGEGARVPPLPFLHNAGADGFLLCGRLRRRISRPHRDTGLDGPYPLLPTAGRPFLVGLILCPTGDGEGEVFRPGPRESSTSGPERLVSRCYGVAADGSVRRPGAVLLRAVECNAHCHCLLQPTRDDTPVEGSELVGVRSAACHGREGRKPPEMSLDGGGEWSRVAKVCSGERTGMNISGADGPAWPGPTWRAGAPSSKLPISASYLGWI